jgi:hypothetical protein
MSSCFFGLLKTPEVPENKGISRYLLEGERPAGNPPAPIGPISPDALGRASPVSCALRSRRAVRLPRALSVTPDALRRRSPPVVSFVATAGDGGAVALPLRADRGRGDEPATARPSKDGGCVSETVQ